MFCILINGETSHNRAKIAIIFRKRAIKTAATTILTPIHTPRARGGRECSHVDFYTPALSRAGRGIK